MQLTLYTDYALRILLYLGAQPNEPVAVSTISDAFGISPHHLSKVAKTLTKEGILRARRGRSGGIQLAVSPSSICIGTFVREHESRTALVECQHPPTNTCPIVRVCQLRRSFDEALDAFFAVLDKYTLADMLHNSDQLLHLLGTPTLRPSKPRSMPSCGGAMRKAICASAS